MRLSFRLALALVIAVVILGPYYVDAKPNLAGGKVKHAATPPPMRWAADESRQGHAQRRGSSRLSKSDIVLEWGNYKERFAKQRQVQTSTLQKLVDTTKKSFVTESERLTAQTRVLEATLIRLMDELSQAQMMIRKAGSAMTMSDPGSIQTVVSVWENTAFAGDMVVLMGQAAIPVIQKNETMLNILAWCTDFSRQFFSGHDLVMVERVRNDLGLDKIAMDVENELSVEWFSGLKQSMSPPSLGGKMKNLKTKKEL